MAATNFTPISLYYTTTAAAAPSAGNLVNGELAINITDGKLYYKDNTGAVKLLAQAPSGGGTFAAPVVIEGTTTDAALRITQLGTGNSLLVEDSSNPDATPFVINASGNVVSGKTTTQAIGSATPQFQIHSTTSSSTWDSYANFNWSASAQAAGLVLAKSRSGTVGTYGILSSGDSIGDINFNGDDGTNFLVAARITAQVDGTPGTNDMPGRLVFSTTADGASSPTERMRIDSSGNVGIGTSSPSYKLDVAGLVASQDAYLLTANSSGTPSAGAFIFRPASNTIALGTNSAERMRIDSTGNVGIGTSSPAFKFQVNSDNVGLVHTDGTRTFATYVDSTGVWLGTRSNNNLQFYTNNGAVQLTLNTSGNLGLGVTPSAWGFTGVSLDLAGNGSLFGGATLRTAGVFLSSNSYYTASGDTFRYKVTGQAATQYESSVGIHRWFNAPSGTAGNAITFTQAMTLDANGYLGIGTTSPSNRLTVSGNETTAQKFNAVGNTFGSGAFLNAFTSAGGNDVGFSGYIASQTSNTTNRLWMGVHSPSGSNQGFVGTPDATPLAFWTNSAERMRIDSSGNVGIGTTSPSGTLDVVSVAPVFGDRRDTSTNKFWRPRIPTYAGTNTGTDWFSPFLIGSTLTENEVNIGGGTSTAVSATRISFWTSATTSTVTGTERMRIDSSGNVLFAKAVRATITTDNDLSFDMNAASNFKSTPTAGGALTFTNITSGQTGNIILVNGSNYAITAAATTKVSATCLATISATGTYWLSYYSDGTNVYVANTGALA